MLTNKLTARFRHDRRFHARSELLQCTIRGPEASVHLQPNAEPELIENTKREMVERVNEWMLQAFDAEAFAAKDSLRHLCSRLGPEGYVVHHEILKMLERLRATIPQVTIEDT